MAKCDQKANLIVLKLAIQIDQNFSVICLNLGNRGLRSHPEGQCLLGSSQN
jgi:hypothetical protein